MKRLIIVLVLLMATFTSNAKIKMSSLFTDGAVLQQQADVAIWGWTDAKQSVNITTSWNKKNYLVKADKDGKFSTKISTPKAGGPYEIKINDGELVIKDILIGEVWLCAGQSNMEMPMKGFPGQPVEGSNLDILKSKNEQLRLISVPRASKTTPQENFEGAWQTAKPEVVRNFSATAYYYGSLLQEMLGVPVGLVEVSFGGSCIQAWMSHDTARPFEWRNVPEPGDTISEVNRTPTVLYNGMLHPVIGYGIKGAIWYQGETNYVDPDEYESYLFPTAVAEWREKWGLGDFPFIYAQIAPFDYSVFTPNDQQEKYNSAFLRDAQRKCLDKIPNSDMVVLMDVGLKDGIHPRKKRVGGERFAMKVLNKVYGMEGFTSSSPSFKALEIKGSSVVVAFNDADMGLTSYGKEVTGFMVAGENKVFYPAQVFLRAKSVVISSPRVDKPVAVRYCFDDFCVPSLFGTNGIPVSSFRTDEWDGAVMVK
ncbi:MAG: sialate O-acetylesterase [Mangrovibacterium sp.]